MGSPPSELDLPRLLRTTGVQGLLQAVAEDYRSAVIRYSTAALKVTTNDDRLLTWARLYLEPILTVEDTDPAVDAELTALLVPPPVYEAAVAGLDWTKGETLPIHLRTQASVARLPGFVCVNDADAAILYVIDETDGRVLSLGVPSALNARDLARQVRELLLDVFLKDDWVVLHSSAVVRAGRAFVFAGDKGSGKTTLALKLLDEEGFEYLANDRLLARADAEGRVELRPYALSIRLGGGTLRNHPTLRRHLHYFDHFDAAVLPLEQQFVHQDKLELTVQEYAEILDIEVADSAVVERVFLPTMDFSDAAATVSSETPDVDEVLAELKASVLIPDPDGAGWLRTLTGRTNELSEGMERTLRTLAEHPARRLRGKPGPMHEEVLSLAGGRRTTAEQPPTGRNHRIRTELRASAVCVLHHRREERRLSLSHWQTRAVHQGEVHELLVVAPDADIAEPVDQVAYLGFATFDAGLLAVGDTLVWNGQRIGELVGFDGTHLPNHMNIVLKAAEEPRTGWELGIRPHDPLIVEPGR